MEAQLPAVAHPEKRRFRSPSIEEQLEALWVGGDEAAAMKAQIEAINTKYPAPSGSA